MTVPIGERLAAAFGSAYQVERELGGGGMSRVFLATETALARRVVIKVLAPEIAADLNVERFRREIALAAGLQHPHIVPVLSAGAVDGLLYYTMPYVDGESLRSRLIREGELPIAEASEIVRDVASALAYAHRQGIVHRDVKPENVLFSDGSAMVVDFGIAKALDASRDDRGRTNLTQTGTSLGTPTYMAPEQAAADPHVDYRADLYSLGVMAYEMLTGHPPFTGRNAQAVLAAHVTQLPEPVNVRRPTVPPAFAAVVMQCLEKRAADRPRTADDVVQALSAVTTPASVTPVSVNGVRTPSRWRPWLLGAGGIVALIAGFWAGHLSGRSSGQSLRIAATIEPPPGVQFLSGAEFAVAPDGKRLVFAGVEADARRSLWIRSLDSLGAVPIEGTEGASHPFWSPDGQSIGFFAAGKLQVISVKSQAIQTLCSAPDGWGGTWGTNNVILFTPGALAGIHRTSPDGDGCRSVTTSDSAMTQQLFPAFLPDGRHFLFSGRGDFGPLMLGDLHDGSKRPLGALGGHPAFVKPDLVLYREANGGSLLAQHLDLRAGRLVGTAERVIPRIASPFGAASFSASWDGVLVADAMAASAQFTAFEYTRDGRLVDSILDPLAPTGNSWSFRISRDGRQVAFGGWGMAAWDRVRRVATRLPVELGAARQSVTPDPVWGPGDTVIAFSRVFSVGRLALRLGAGDSLYHSSGQVSPTDWSPDGRHLILAVAPRDSIPFNQLLVYSLDDRSVHPLSTSRANQYDGRFSPDGRWVVYSSDETGSREVYIRAFPGVGEPVRVSINGGSRPVWLSSGSEVAYLAGGEQIMVASVTLGASVSVGIPHPAPIAAPVGAFDMTPDGSSVIVARTMPISRVLLLGWTARLQAVP